MMRTSNAGSCSVSSSGLFLGLVSPFQDWAFVLGFSTLGAHSLSKKAEAQMQAQELLKCNLNDLTVEIYYGKALK